MIISYCILEYTSRRSNQVDKSAWYSRLICLGSRMGCTKGDIHKYMQILNGLTGIHRIIKFLQILFALIFFSSSTVFHCHQTKLLRVSTSERLDTFTMLEHLERRHGLDPAVCSDFIHCIDIHGNTDELTVQGLSDLLEHWFNSLAWAAPRSSKIY